MNLFVKHYYPAGTIPFRSLCDLSDDQAIEIMRQLYDESLFGKRFVDPLEYLRNRRATEKWVRDEFSAKRRNPFATHPIYMVVGRSRWLERHAPSGVEGEMVQIPLEYFNDDDISFTYPDSMLSSWFGNTKPSEFYLERFHGKVFDKSEIINIIEEMGLPEDSWNVNLPEELAPYIEAQVWNHEKAKSYFDSNVAR
jgi:hypothetical protein